MTDDDSLIARLRKAARLYDYEERRVINEAADRIAALTAELAEVDTEMKRAHAGWEEAINRADIWEERAARMQRERDANAKDAERLSWLDRDDIELSFHVDTEGDPFVEIRDSKSGRLVSRAGDIRAVIDAALKEKP